MINLLWLFVFFPVLAQAEVRFEQKVNVQVQRSLHFRDESGRDVRLGDYFVPQRPVVLVLSYFKCPNLCTEVFNGLAEAMRDEKFGHDLFDQNKFTVLTVSIDPNETTKLAFAKKHTYLARLGQVRSRWGEENWHFLTADQPNIASLTSSVGFNYNYDERSGQFAHPAGLIVLTPEGKVSKYLFGARFAARDLRLGLIEASRGQIGRVFDQVLLFCYHYDPVTGKYGSVVMQVLRGVGLATILLLAALIFFFLRHERSKKIMLNGLVWSFPLFPKGASTVAGQVDSLFITLLFVSALLLFAVFVTIVFFSIKYRKHSAADRSPRKLPRWILEVAWVAIPLLGFIFLFIPATKLYYEMNTPPADAEDVYVVGKQWMWKFQHPDGTREINELHVPIGHRIRLTMTSEDVIHSLFVPAFRIKHDVLPNQYVTTWFEATEEGEFHLFCTQYCGTAHSMMRGRVIAMKPSRYERWLEDQKQTAPSMAGHGAQLFKNLGCVNCHGAGATLNAPQLEGLYGRRIILQGGRSIIADDNYVRESILNPSAKIVEGFQPIMPSFQGRINEEEVLALLNYIKSLQLSRSEGKASE